jgi:hypothetical protein
MNDNRPAPAHEGEDCYETAKVSSQRERTVAAADEKPVSGPIETEPSAARRSHLEDEEYDKGRRRRRENF